VTLEVKMANLRNTFHSTCGDTCLDSWSYGRIPEREELPNATAETGIAIRIVERN
jgi:hypothetical protein